MDLLSPSKCISSSPLFLCGWLCVSCRVAVFQMSPEGLYKQQMAITGPLKVCGAQKKTQIV